MNAPAQTSQTSIAKLPLRQVKDVRSLLINEQAMGQLGKVAAKHMNPERMMRVVANAIRTTPQLSECDPMSMLGALMTAASLGLEPNTPLGHAYLIPFKNNRKGITEVQFIIGYKGFADLARRSGQIVSLHADVVYSDDELWSYEYGSDMHLRHKPGPRKGVKTHAYCHVKLHDGQAFVVLPWDVVIATRDKSQGWKTAVRFGKTAQSPWSEYEDRMAAKTAVRALANAGEMPLSIEFNMGVDSDERVMSFDMSSGMPEAIPADDAGDVIDGQTFDPETGEVTRQIEHDRTPPVDLRANKEPEKAKAPQQERQSAPQERQQRQEEPDQRKPAEEARTRPQPAQREPEQQKGLDLDQEQERVKVDDREQFVSLLNLLKSEIKSSGADVVEELYGEQMAHLRHATPDLYAQLVEALDAARASSGGEG